MTYLDQPSNQVPKAAWKMAESATPCVASWQHIAFFRENWIGQTFRMVGTCWDRLKPHQLKHFFFGGYCETTGSTLLRPCSSQMCHNVSSVHSWHRWDIQKNQIGSILWTKMNWNDSSGLDLWRLPAKDKELIGKTYFSGCNASMIQWWCIEKICFYASGRRRNTNHTHNTVHKPWKQMLELPCFVIATPWNFSAMNPSLQVPIQIRS